jgi:hypothetical protein
LEWEVIYRAGQSRAVDLFLNFPVMDMNRNAIWKSQEKAPAGGVERMTRYWGNDSWKDVAYAESPQGGFGFLGREIQKQDNDKLSLPSESG